MPIQYLTWIEYETGPAQLGAGRSRRRNVLGLERLAFGVPVGFVVLDVMEMVVVPVLFDVAVVVRVESRQAPWEEAARARGGDNLWHGSRQRSRFNRYASQKTAGNS